jgi:hypothetical protein
MGGAGNLASLYAGCIQFLLGPFKLGRIAEIMSQQLELFPWMMLSVAEGSQILGEIRRAYWHIRNLRGSYHVAKKRTHYRRVESQKKRLLMAGVGKRQILDFLACCRSGCRAKNSGLRN